MEQESISMGDDGDKTLCVDSDHDSNSAVDAFAAVVLVVIFVATCIFWISGQ